MKKFIFPIVIASATLSTPVYADFSWYSATRTHLSNRLVDSDKEYVGGIQELTKIRYSDKFKRLESVVSEGVKVVNYNNSGYLQVNAKNENDGQCVSFVKAVANVNKPTYEWQPAKQVGVDEIKVGRVIALINSDGKYPQGGAGHVGIYLGQDSDGIWMLDQNWATNIVGIHKIKFGLIPNKGPGKGDGNKYNAYSYFTIK